MNGPRAGPVERPPLRILASVDPWWGSCGNAFARGFHRMGHEVHVVPSERFVPPGWASLPLRALRRLLRPRLVAEYGRALEAVAAATRPDLFFVYKGTWVPPEAVRSLRAGGAVAVNVYPDVSFTAHGPYIPRALPLYDWVFTTKSFGLEDMRRALDVRSASLLPHFYDPEIHRPPAAVAAEYACDVAFVGTWSPKKEEFLVALAAALPGAHLRIWGDQWGGARPRLGNAIQGRSVTGREYALALAGARIALCILSEARRGASSGDLVTSRTFEIPACGAFLLHERTAELARFFDEGTECAAFADAAEAAALVKRYLADEPARRAVARAGRLRAERSGYSVDDRARELLDRVAVLRASRRAGGNP